MNRQTNHFGFGASGRPSGIRPPSAYSQPGQGRPKLSSNSSSSTIPSSASSRKATNNHLFAPSSGGSRTSNVGGMSRQSIFGNSRVNPFASARKSMTAKLGPLFGMTPQHNRPSFQPNTGSSIQSSNRRSSIAGRGHIKDSRPLSDASYQSNCVKKLIAFLTDNSYPHPISKTLGTRPTVSDISKVFEVIIV